MSEWETVGAESWEGLAKLLGAMGFIFVFAGILVTGWVRTHNAYRSFDLYEYKWQLLLQERAPCDWLLLGDSTGNLGLDAALFEKRLGGRALNLSTTIATSSAADAWFVETLIHRGVIPTHVVVMRTLLSWISERPAASSWSRIPLSWKERRRLRPEIGENMTSVFTRYWPPFAALGASLEFPTAAVPKQMVVEIDGFQGNMVTDPSYLLQEVPSRKLPPGEKGEFSLTPSATASLRILSDEAARYGFDLYIVFPPWQEEHQNSPEIREYQNVYRLLFETFLISPNVHLVSPPLTFPKRDFIDARHLSYQGAWRFTNALIDQLTPILLLESVRRHDRLIKAHFR